jgi:hypothetical protein
MGIFAIILPSDYFLIFWITCFIIFIVLGFLYIVCDIFNRLYEISNRCKRFRKARKYNNIIAKRCSEILKDLQK